MVRSRREHDVEIAALWYGGALEIRGDPMNLSHRHTPRRSVVALAIILLGVFLVVPSAASAGGGSKVERFLLLSTDPSDTATPTVLAFGPIHARGTDTVVSDTEDTFVFPEGTLSVTHHPKKSGDSFDEVTCLFRFWERGSYQITGGTGAYAGAHGHGHYTVKAQGVGCDETAPPEEFSLEIQAKGPLHLK
jgi:hypothetical protein